MRNQLSMATSVCGLLVVLVAGTASAQVINDPVAYYDFESGLTNRVTEGLPGGTAFDAINIENSTTSGPATGFTGDAVRPAGIFGNGANFVEVGDDVGGNGIQVPYGTLALGNSFTVSAWYWQDLTAFQREAVFSSATNYDVTWETGPAVDTFDAWVGQEISTRVQTPQQNWHHVLQTFEADPVTGNTTLSVYVNGAVVAPNVGDGVNVTSAVDFPAINFGVFRNGNDRWFDGVIDEVALWDRALDATEAAAVYNRTLNGQALEFTPGVPFIPGLDDAIDLSIPAGASSSVNATGWDLSTFAESAGPNNDLGDAGFGPIVEGSGQYARTITSGDNTLTVTLTDLPAHSDISIAGLIAQLDSLDPIRDGDRFIIKVDGVEVFERGLGYGVGVGFTDGTFTDAAGNEIPVPAGASVIADENLFDSASFNENVYSLFAFEELQKIPHTSSSLTLEIIGRQNQSGGEFYGLDNLSIEIDALLSDADGNGIEDENDFYAISDNLGNSVAPGTLGDLTRNGLVDLGDFRMWKDNAPAPVLAALGFTTVPEPSSVAMVGLALAACAMMVRRRAS